MAVLFALSGCGPETGRTPYLVTLTPSAIVVATLTPAPPLVDLTASLPPPAAVSPTNVLAAPAPPAPTDLPLPASSPAPTPVPTAWPAPLAVPGASKMGIHVIFNNDPRIMEFVRRVKPRVVKAVDSLGWLSDVKQASPLTITIGRFTNAPDRNVLDGKDPSQYPDPADFARQFIAHFLNEYHLNPGVDYWEGWNEFPPVSPAQWAWYAQFEANRACQMNELGLKAAIGGFSAGTPEYPDMAYFLPAIEAAKRCSAIFTLHEYSSPTLQTGVNSGIPNAALVTDAGSLTLRYRYWYEGYLKPRNLVVPLVVSEAGIDSHVGPGCPLGGGEGWLACHKDWDAMNLGPDKAQVYLNQLEWYDNELRMDDYVLGFTIFSAGTPDQGAWQSFGINDLLISMATYMATQ
jgi:hypothetical protein